MGNTQAPGRGRPQPRAPPPDLISELEEAYAEPGTVLPSRRGVPSRGASPPPGGGGGGPSDSEIIAASLGGRAQRETRRNFHPRVVCPRCRTILAVPDNIFRCPCGEVLTYEPAAANAAAADTMFFRLRVVAPADAAAVPRTRVRRRLGGGGPGDGGAADIEARARSALSRLPAEDPHAAFLEEFLRRLPRHPDGRLNVPAVERLARQLDEEGARGAPQGVIDLLPTRRFFRTAGARSAALAGREDLTRCLICLSDFETGDVLRTLPCLHQYHQSCVDTHLRANRSCPLCRSTIDIDQEAVLRDILGPAFPATPRAGGGDKGGGGGKGGSGEGGGKGGGGGAGAAKAL